MLNKNIIPNFVFFDGPEEPEVALNDFKLLENSLPVGAFFSMHDWCTNVRKYDSETSTKALYLKDYINSFDNWILIEEEKHKADDKHKYDYTFQTYIRKE